MTVRTAPGADALAFLRERLVAQNALSGLVALALAFGVGALLILSMGVNPIEACAVLFQASLGSTNGLAETAIRTVPLALAGIGIALSFRAGVFNVGAEGQIFIGGIATAFVGVQLAGAPSAIVLPAMAAAAMLAGAFWSSIAGVLKLRFGADELITTIMLNYVAIHFVSYLLHGPLQAPGSPLAQTERLARELRLPILVPTTRLHAGILLVILVTVAAQVWLWLSVGGFRLRSVGHNPRAARSAGINVTGVTLLAFVLCGALSGLAGFSEVAGVHRRMIENLSPGFGYTAIIVALLGRTSPLGVLMAATLFAALQIGSSTMESALGVPGALIAMIQALVVLFLIGQGALFTAIGHLLRRRTAPETQR
ncbi:ABC transporter permease [Tropicimonas sediminicola]|uniref:Nucleoside ABC transporter membrane protein n=1 Tax=Tropicimonas sediminicola TaxID=1031541 RepID=A0A239DG13_9RHOB|nr:ABC transporter permease [Tropicimonas sediminicola]SNS31446.1 nucleoside ABC transporter membrane protein [Tropicimonas sediminicola]